MKKRNTTKYFIVSIYSIFTIAVISLMASLVYNFNTASVIPLPFGQEERSLTEQSRLVEQDGGTPLYFEENQGQQHQEVKYMVQNSGYKIYFTPKEAVYTLVQRGNSAEVQHLIFRQQFKNTTTHSVTAQNQQRSTINYYKGNNQAKWKTNIPTFSQVTYNNLYKGIDLVYYGSNSQLKYEFIVNPNGNIRDIVINYHTQSSKSRPTTQLSLSPSGDLMVTAKNCAILRSNCQLVEKAPYTYQLINGQQVELPSRFILTGPASYSFEVPDYNPNLPLVIDPGIVWSTYLGGSGNDSLYGMKVDSTGNIYLLGESDSTNYPLSDSASWPAYEGGITDMVVTKLSNSGQLVWSTYLGSTNGSARDYATDLVLSSSGDPIIVGHTGGTDYPILNAYRANNAGAEDIVVTKLDAIAGNNVFSTYLGGSGYDESPRVDVDTSNNIYIFGTTSSSDFPTTSGAFSETQQALFVSKLNANGASLSYSTYIGGSTTTLGYIVHTAGGIAVTSSGQATITGTSTANNYPTTAGALQEAYAGTGTLGFVTKLASNGASLSYSTYLGGGKGDVMGGIKVNSADQAIIVGSSKGGHPTTLSGSPYDSMVGGGDPFISVLATNGTSLVASRYIQISDEPPASLSLTSAGKPIIGLATSDGAFSGVGSVNTFGGFFDPLVIQLSADLTTTEFASYIGGASGSETTRPPLTTEQSGNIYVAGSTASSDFLTIAAHQSIFGGNVDLFALKIDPNLSANANSSPSVSAGADASVATNAHVSLLGSSSDTDGSVSANVWSQTAGPTVTINTSDQVSASFTPTSAGIYTFTLTATDNLGARSSDSVTITVEDFEVQKGFLSPPLNANSLSATGTISIPFSAAPEGSTINSGSLPIYSRALGLLSCAYAVNSGTITCTTGVTLPPNDIISVFVTDEVKKSGSAIGARFFESQLRVVPISGPGEFGTPINSANSALTGVNSMDVTDADHDGKMDVVVTTANKVVLLKGDGSGSFSIPTGPVSGWSTKTGAKKVVAGDVNKDGYSDLIVLADQYFQVMYYSLQAGTFSEPAGNYQTYESDKDIALATNHDTVNVTSQQGVLDVFTAGGNESRQAPNNGTGTYDGIEGKWVQLTDLQSITFADTNGDGIKQRFLAQGNSSIYSRNPWAGTFSSSAQVLPRAMMGADLNGDGNDDLIALTANSLTNPTTANLSIFIYNSAGTQTVHTNYSISAGSSAFDVADIDGDADLDVVVAQTDTDAIVVFKNNGTGTFGTGTSYKVGDQPTAIRVSDFDGDGKADLLVANAGDGTLSMLPGGSDGATTQAPTTQAPAGTTAEPSASTASTPSTTAAAPGKTLSPGPVVIDPFNQFGSNSAGSTNPAAVPQNNIPPAPKSPEQLITIPDIPEEEEVLSTPGAPSNAQSKPAKRTISFHTLKTLARQQLEKQPNITNISETFKKVVIQVNRTLELDAFTAETILSPSSVDTFTQELDTMNTTVHKQLIPFTATLGDMLEEVNKVLNTMEVLENLEKKTEPRIKAQTIIDQGIKLAAKIESNEQKPTTMQIKRGTIVSNHGGSSISLNPPRNSSGLAARNELKTKVHRTVAQKINKAAEKKATIVHVETTTDEAISKSSKESGYQFSQLINIETELENPLPANTPVVAIALDDSSGNLKSLVTNAIAKPNGKVEFYTDTATVFIVLPITDAVELGYLNKAPDFTDITGGYEWAGSFVNKLATLNVIGGKTPHRFAPEDPITRAELTKIALLTFGFSFNPEVTATGFTDTLNSHWANAVIRRARETNIIGGYADNTFRPDAPVTRAEAMKILLKAAQIDVTGQDTTTMNFPDTESSQWYAPYVAYAAQNMIVSGFPNGTFGPSLPITRAAVSKIAVNLRSSILGEGQSDSVSSLDSASISQGATSAFPSAPLPTSSSWLTSLIVTIRSSIASILSFVSGSILGWGK
jgi:hypothetical protein